MADRLVVAVVFGGRSPEREVSKASARAVLQAMNPDRYDVIPVEIDASGVWRDALEPEPRTRTLVLHGRTLCRLDGGEAAACRLLDVVMPLLHGSHGEDGSIQGLLEMAGVPYTGCGLLASAVCFDKDFTKRILANAGVAVAPHVVVGPETNLSVEDRERLGLPVFVKPARGGSSLGVSKVESWHAFDEALGEARRFDAKVLVEPAIAGAEVSCAVLDDPHSAIPLVSPAARVEAPGHDWYDHDAKYTDKACEIVGADLSADEWKELAHLAVRAYSALDCRGYARIDVFRRPDGSFLVNEVNSIPGMAEDSLFVALWGLKGWSFPDIVDRLIAPALPTNRDAAAAGGPVSGPALG